MLDLEDSLLFLHVFDRLVLGFAHSLQLVLNKLHELPLLVLLLLGLVVLPAAVFDPLYVLRGANDLLEVLQQSRFVSIP